MLAVVGIAGVPLAMGALVQALATGLQVALGVQALAIANQAPQSILSLFQ